MAQKNFASRDPRKQQYSAIHMTRRNFGTEGNRYGLGQAGSAQRHRFRAQVFQERNDWNRIDRSQVLGDGGMYGHVGCVNALCWGWVHNNYQLLSGSDDTRICMWGPSAEMDPTPGTPYPLELYGSIDTAHRQNIFDLKYIPHANHPTIVSVAGDSRILVYDVERLPKTTEALETPALDGRYGTGVRELHCHNDRVKKISTEDNPHVFLTASEDGTVRQHDLRAHHSCPTTITRGNCPAPLFEAPRGIELSTLSLSQLQPYLFTVAGTSQYAYLQDRRMVRHINREWRLQEEQESQVHCVRRFAMSSPSVSSGPVGSSLIRHITAVQMNPDVADELLVSFTGHSIALYSINDCPAFDGFPSPSSTGKSRLRFLDHTGSSQSTALCNEGDPGSMPDIRSTNELCLGNSDSHAATESDIAEIPQQTLMDESADSDSDMPSGSSDTEIEESSDWPFGRDDGLYHNFLSDEIFNGVPTILPRMRYAGIRNTQTVKDVTFLGPTGTSVCSGSDDGNWFVWDKSSGQLQGIWKGDEDVVNVIVQHPSLPIYAVSGIDSTVKIFAPMDSSSISNYSRMADADMVISKNIENGRSRLQGTTAIERYTAALASDAGFFDQTELAEQTGRSPAENCRLQ